MRHAARDHHDNISNRVCYWVSGAVKARIEPDVGDVRPLEKECVSLTRREVRSHTLYASNGAGKTVSLTIRR